MPPITRRHLLGSVSQQLVSIATYQPIVTVVLGALLAVLSFVGGLRVIEIHTSRADLLNPKNEYHRRWLAYVEEFSEQEDVYVVVESESFEKIPPVLSTIASRLAERPEYFRSILWEVDKGPLKAKGLYYVPTEQLQQLAEQVSQLRDAFNSQIHLLAPAHFLSELTRWTLTTQSLQPLLDNYPQIVASLWALKNCLATETAGEFARAGVSHSAPTKRSGEVSRPMAENLAAGADGESDSFLLSPDGRLGLLILRFTPDTGKQFTRFGQHIGCLRGILQEVSAEHPEVSIGATGLPLLEYDEMKASTSSAAVAALSLSGVVFVFFAGFGGVRYPLAVSFSLLIGVIWSVGYAAIAVGHLNILTSAFGAMLIGLGDYGVHFVSHYLGLRQRVPNTRQSLIETAGTVGPGIATGALTTAAAYFAGALTDFLGVAELGIIAGGGVLLCWLSDMTVLPAILCLIDGRAAPRPSPSPLKLAPRFSFLTRAPKAITMGVAVATVFLALGLSGLRYDYNLLNLQPVGLDSVETQEKLVTHMSRSSYFALSVAPTLEEARRRKAEFLKLPTVDRVEDLSSLLPEDIEVKRPLVDAIVAAMAPLTRMSTVLPQELDRILATLGNLFAPLPRGNEVALLIQGVREQLASLSPEEIAKRLENLPRTACAGISLPADSSLNISSDPPGLGDLPAPLVERFVGRSGKHLLQIYCKGDFWNPATMRRFVSDVRKVDPAATGNPIQIYEACHQMNRAYIEAALYAFFGILIALYLDFRNLKDVFLALIPLFLGMICLFGLMGWLDLPLNPANMITLPLILGIGIDNGVHIIHDFRRQGNRYQIPEDATLVAVVVNSLTTMIGFSALMLSPHRGLESLGRVLTLGVGFTLFTAVLMPGFLRWIHGLLKVKPGTEDSWTSFLHAMLNQTEEHGEVEEAKTSPCIVPRKIFVTEEASPSAAELDTQDRQIGESKNLHAWESSANTIHPRRAA